MVVVVGGKIPSPPHVPKRTGGSCFSTSLGDSHFVMTIKKRKGYQLHRPLANLFFLINSGNGFKDIFSWPLQNPYIIVLPSCDLKMKIYLSIQIVFYTITKRGLPQFSIDKHQSYSCGWEKKKQSQNFLNKSVYICGPWFWIWSAIYWPIQKLKVHNGNP